MVFSLCISILIIRTFQRKHFSFDFSRFSKSYFTKTTGFISSIRVDIERFLLVEYFQMWQLPICVPCICVFPGEKPLILFVASKPDDPKNLLSTIFLDIQTHPPLSPITTGFISSIKVWIKSLLVVRRFLMVIMSILFFSMEHWLSDIKNFAIYQISPRY